MQINEQLARFDAPPELAKWVGETVQKLLDQTQAQSEIIRQREMKIQALTLELAHLRRMRYGVRSEALGPEQGLLFDEALGEDEAALRARAEALAPQKKDSGESRPRNHPGRQALPAHLPRVEYRHEPESCLCGRCGQALSLIGEDVSEQLDVEPARFFVNRHIRPQYACRGCETVQAAPVPARIVEGGLAAIGLYVWVITSKYLDHLPLYRVQGIAQRQGVELSRATLAQWVGRIGVSLEPLADRLREWLKQCVVLHADETPVGQLDPGSGKTKRAYLWAYRSGVFETGPPIVVFDYQGSRAGVHAQRFLEGWSGHLMVDDYSGYKPLCGTGVTELACLAHLRRKYFEANAASASPIAVQALERIGELYAIEAQVHSAPATERAQVRAALAKPKVEELHRWLVATRLSVANGSGTARAIDHTLKRWEAFTRYLTRGDFPIDNNPVENAIRPIVLGKKNWLFTGTENAGKRAAVIQTLLATAKLNDLDPAAWLRDTLEKLPTWPNSRIDELLPLRHCA